MINVRKTTNLLVSILLIFLSYYVYSEWYYLPFVYNGHGSEYNDQRIKLELPLVESYFEKKYPDAKRSVIWYTPKEKAHEYVHVGKMYNTSKGQLIFERDHFVLWYGADKNKELIRNYDFLSDSVSYELIEYSGATQTVHREVNKIEGDSIMHTWLSE